MAQEKLPKGWKFVEVVKLELVGYKEGKPQFKEAGIKKTVTLPEEQINVLNTQKNNTKLYYKIVEEEKPKK